MSKRTWRWFLSLCLISGILTGCASGNGGPGAAPAATPGAAPDRPVIIVDSFAVSGLDPVHDGVPLVKWGMGEMLARVNVKGELEPWLAAGWRAIDPLRWEIKLREGVTFWDGTPVDAAAVKASLERTAAQNPAARAELQAAAIEVVDARTLVITTRSPNAALPAALAQWKFVIHSAAAARAKGDDAFAREPVLTGPFKPVEFKKDEVTTLVRHDAYWGGKPFLERIQVKLVKDGNTRVMALQSGDADLALNVPVESVGTLRQQPGIWVHETLGGAQEFVLLNPATPPLDDPAVRRAISLGLDRRMLARQVLGGSVEAAGDVYAPIYPWALPHLYPTDVAQAARLLDEAGWRPGPDGIRQKNGKPLAFTALWYPQRTDLQPLGIALQAQLKALGMQVELKMVEQIDAALKAPGWGAALYYNNTAPGGDPQYLLDTFFKSGSKVNFGAVHPEMDRLTEAIRTTIDSGERAKLVRRVQEFLAEQVPMVPLVAKKEILAVSERLQNVRPHPVSIYVIDAAFGR